MSNAAPPTLAAVDPVWVGAELKAGGHSTATVSELRAEAVAVAGATTDMARLRLTYADDGDPGPATMIAKIRGRNEVKVQMDAAMGLFEREGRFYAELADQVPVAKPCSYGVGDGDATPLLLEDLAGLRMGDQMEGLTPDEAGALMDALGDLHAAFWQKPAIEAGWLASPAEGVFAGMICQLVASGAPALAERYSGRAPDEVLAAVAETAPEWQRVLARIAEGPQTLVHNDCRLDNLFFDDAGRPIFIDWQLTARTRGTQDVGYLLGGSMDSEDLSANWEGLVQRYHARLTSNGVTGYSLDECIHHYRQTVLYALGAGMALLGAMDIGDGRGLGDAIVLRCLNHIAELDSFDAL